MDDPWQPFYLPLFSYSSSSGYSVILLFLCVSVTGKAILCKLNQFIFSWFAERKFNFLLKNYIILCDYTSEKGEFRGYLHWKVDS